MELQRVAQLLEASLDPRQNKQGPLYTLNLFTCFVLKMLQRSWPFGTKNRSQDTLFVCFK